MSKRDALSISAMQSKSKQIVPPNETGYRMRPNLMDALEELDEDGDIKKTPLGEIKIGNFTLAQNGLKVTGEPTHEQWKTVGEHLARLNTSMQWLIGDWLAYGERSYAQTYEALAKELGIQIGTAYQYSYVAKSVDFCTRVQKLSFGHHREVAPKGEALQAAWLQYAAHFDLTRAELLALIAVVTPFEQEDEEVVLDALRSFPSPKDLYERVTGQPYPTKPKRGDVWERVDHEISKVQAKSTKLKGEERAKLIIRLEQWLNELKK